MGDKQRPTSLMSSSNGTRLGEPKTSTRPARGVGQDPENRARGRHWEEAWLKVGMVPVVRSSHCQEAQHVIVLNNPNSVLSDLQAKLKRFYKRFPASNHRPDQCPSRFCKPSLPLCLPLGSHVSPLGCHFSAHLLCIDKV